MTAPRHSPGPLVVARIAARPWPGSGSAGLVTEPLDRRGVLRLLHRAEADDDLRARVLDCSPSLSAALDRCLAGPDGEDDRQLLKLVLALHRYRLRVSTRATPFRLLAGTAIATLGSAEGETTRFELEGETVVMQRGVSSTARRPESFTEGAGLEGRPVLRSASAVVVAGEVRVNLADLGVTRTLKPHRVLEAVLDECRTARRADELATDVVGRTGCEKQHVDQALQLLVTAGAVLDLSGGLPEEPSSERTPRLRIDATIRLGSRVREQLEGLAGVLARIAGRRENSRTLEAFGDSFLERYGTCAVPLGEVFDPVRGLGGRFTALRAAVDEGAPEPGDAAHDRIVMDLAQGAAAAGLVPVELDDATIDQLEGKAPPAPPPDQFDLRVHLAAASTAEIDAGRFGLHVAGRGGLGPALASAGALGSLHPDLAAEVRRTQGQDGVELGFRRRGRDGEDACLGESGLALDARPPTRVATGVEDYALRVRAGRFELLRVDGGQVVRPVAHTLLTSDGDAEIVQFLRSAPSYGASSSQWKWGQAHLLPWLPTITWHGHVLSPGRWRPPTALTDRTCSWEEWRRRWARFRADWRVPDHLRVAHGGESLAVFVTDELDLRVVRGELGKHPDALLLEDAFGADPRSRGWSDGRLVELVVPFHREPSTQPAPQRGPIPVTVPRQQTIWLPGGRWCHLKLYAPPSSYDRLLSDRLPSLVAELGDAVDSWHFLRYADPRHHLRLRFRARCEKEGPQAVRLVISWASRQVREGLAGELQLSSWRPEPGLHDADGLLDERLLAAAGASSRTAVDALRDPALSSLPPTERFVATCLVGLRHRGPGDALAAAWRDALPRGAPVDRRALATAWRAAASPIGSALAESSRALASALAVVDAHQVLPVTHLHFHRLHGGDRRAEATALSVLRAGVQRVVATAPG